MMLTMISDLLDYGDAIFSAFFCRASQIVGIIIVISIGLERFPRSVGTPYSVKANRKILAFPLIPSYLISLIRSSLGSLHYFCHLRCDSFITYRFLAFPFSPSYF